MSDRMTEVELDELRELHSLDWQDTHNGEQIEVCHACADLWPCEKRQLLDEIERLRRIAAAMRAALEEER